MVDNVRLSLKHTDHKKSMTWQHLAENKAVLKSKEITKCINLSFKNSQQIVCVTQCEVSQC